MITWARALKGRDIRFLPGALYHISSVSNRSVPGNYSHARRGGKSAHPGALKAQLPPLQDVGAGGDIQGGGLRVAAGNVVVEGVDALEDGDLMSFPAAGVPRLSLRIWRANSKWGTMTHSPGQLVKGLVQQLHVQQFGGLVVDVPLRRAGGGPAVEGLGK